jgi:hypothetical protein
MTQTTTNQHEGELEAVEQGYGVRDRRRCGFCSFANRHKVVTIVTFAAIGVGIGVGLSNWEPTDPASKDIAIQWIGLIGDLFLRVLKCVVLPVSFQFPPIFSTHT